MTAPQLGELRAALQQLGDHAVGLFATPAAARLRRAPLQLDIRI